MSKLTTRQVILLACFSIFSILFVLVYASLQNTTETIVIKDENERRLLVVKDLEIERLKNELSKIHDTLNSKENELNKFAQQIKKLSLQDAAAAQSIIEQELSERQQELKRLGHELQEKMISLAKSELEEVKKKELLNLFQKDLMRQKLSLSELENTKKLLLHELNDFLKNNQSVPITSKSEPG